MNEIKHQSESWQEPVITFSMKINGRIYTVRAFFKDNCAETLQQKIERLIRREMLSDNPDEV